MIKTFGELTNTINIRQATIRHLCKDFGIEFKEQFVNNEKWYTSKSELKDEFIKFILRNKDFIVDYESDYYSDKTPMEIAETIGRDLDELLPHLKKEYPNNFKSNKFNKYLKHPFRYISSFKIDFNLGGNYDNIISYCKKEEKTESPEEETRNDDFDSEIIGYEDIKAVIYEQLEPILNPEDIYEWGLENPGGILLFGPPGCGKTFWGQNISDIIEYEFEEMPRSLFGSSLVDGAMINLKNKLSEYEKNSRTVLFFDEFDSVASMRTNSTSGSAENSKVVNTLLQEIPKLINKKVLLIAATNYIEYLDSAVVRPGRFDLKIPVFPPNIDERAELIVNKLCRGLKEGATLMKILKYNNADKKVFWKEISNKMVLYSSSLVIDYTKLIKRKLKGIYTKKQTWKIELTDVILTNLINETDAKITKQDAELFSQFYNEVKNMGGNKYQDRLDWLHADLETYYESIKEPPKPIGFRHPSLELD